MNLEFVEQSLRIGPTSTNCSDAVHGEQRKKKESNARRREKWGMWRARERGVVDLVTPPTAGKPGSASTTTRTAVGGFGRPPLLSAVLNRETGGEGLTCGGHV